MLFDESCLQRLSFSKWISSEGNLKENIIYTPLTICKRIFNTYSTVLKRPNTVNKRILLFSNKYHDKTRINLIKSFGA
jgi:hypothetical protein